MLNATHLHQQIIDLLWLWIGARIWSFFVMLGNWQILKLSVVTESHWNWKRPPQY